MPFIELPSKVCAESIRIRYDERGPTDGRPLVLAHGFTVSLEMWMPQIEALSKEYRLITWDARGHGGSSAPVTADAYSMPEFASDLRGLLEHLHATDGAIIGGMSFGGQIALQYAVEHPGDTHALILSDSTTIGPVERSDDDEVPEWAGDPGIEGGMHAMRTRPDLTPDLPSLTMPTLVIAGTEDGMILPGLGRLVDGLPRRRVSMIQGIGHGTSGQRPGAWNDAVLRFLADAEAGASLGETETL